MKQSTHGAYLTQLTRLPHIFPVNVYLVREEDGLTLIDTAIPKSADSILQATRDMGQTITRIALTHAHGDHVGSLDALHQALPEAEVSISARDGRFLRGDRSLDPGEPQSRPRGQFVTVQTVPTRLLSPGDRVGSL
jgi:glyoxylase-like metal-dependent hydrolase (beta-lactamase superfamily II)